jgi:hypothetical protein
MQQHTQKGQKGKKLEREGGKERRRRRGGGGGGGERERDLRCDPFNERFEVCFGQKVRGIFHVLSRHCVTTEPRKPPIRSSLLEMMCGCVSIKRRKEGKGRNGRKEGRKIKEGRKEGVGMFPSKEAGRRLVGGKGKAAQNERERERRRGEIRGGQCTTPRSP